ncbi:MAG: UDP-N-acetylmuramate dehydrogenase [Planctomycetales bacterium]|nr:UDP-N-acetylmuramate dehydrogenase [Planctomycetales bacterium]
MDLAVRHRPAASLLEGIPDCTVRAGAPLAPCTTYGIGGPAEALAEPASVEALREVLGRCRDAGVPVRVMGGGANLLVSDAGVDGVVVRTRRLRGCYRYGNRVTAEAGLPIPGLVTRCAEWGLAGAEALAGIPGTVGGAIAMNAGGRQGEIAPLVESVETCTPDGVLRVRAAADMGFAYRTADLRSETVVAATLGLRREDPAAVRSRAQAIHDAKAATQPLRDRSAGCVFRNPGGKVGAGFLIDAAGLKGATRGGAMVSPRHANFIVNACRATAADVTALAEHVRERVRERFGVSLESEIRIWA